MRRKIWTAVVVVLQVASTDAYFLFRNSEAGLFALGIALALSLGTLVAFLVFVAEAFRTLKYRWPSTFGALIAFYFLPPLISFQMSGGLARSYVPYLITMVLRFIIVGIVYAGAVRRDKAPRNLRDA